MIIIKSNQFNLLFNSSCRIFNIVHVSYEMEIDAGSILIRKIVNKII